MNDRSVSLRLTLASIVILSLSAVTTVWMAWTFLESATDSAKQDRLLPALRGALAIAESAVERERASFLRDIPQLARNGEVRQLLFNARRRPLSSPSIVTNAAVLRIGKMETAALIYDRIPLVILSASPTPLFTSALLDSSVLFQARRNPASWTLLRESDRIFVGGLNLYDVADSCYLVAAARIDSSLLTGKERIEVVMQYMLTESDDSLATSVWIPLSTGMALMILSLVAFGYIARSVRANLSSLQYAMKQTENHNLDYKLLSRARFSEITPVFEAYNTMVTQLASRQHRLMYLEKVSAWREIAQRMAHEIKNPLTPIQLTIEQLRDSYTGNDTKFGKLLQQSAEMILEEIESLRILTKEFSEFARLPALKFQTVNLSNLISDAVRMYGSSPIETELPADVHLDADPDALRRVLVNLIENARVAILDVSSGKILIKLVAAEDEILWEVADNGIGIPQSNVTKIFDPYFGTRATGMGLGLAIVKSIIEEHRGTIDVDSVENRGTIFRIRLPKKILLMNGKEPV